MVVLRLPARQVRSSVGVDGDVSALEGRRATVVNGVGFVAVIAAIAVVLWAAGWYLHKTEPAARAEREARRLDGPRSVPSGRSWR